MKQEYRVMMYISDAYVPSSCIKSGTLANCEATAKRLNRSKEKHKSVAWKVLPCISTRKETT